MLTDKQWLLLLLLITASQRALRALCWCARAADAKLHEAAGVSASDGNAADGTEEVEAAERMRHVYCTACSLSAVDLSCL